MKRRDIVLLLCTIPMLRSQLATAQAPDRVRRTGWVEGLRTSAYNWAEVAEHLKPLGWRRGGNVQADIHLPTNFDQFPKIAKEIVEGRPDLIVTKGIPATQAMFTETKISPILFFDVSDPVGNGIVSNLARPGGTVTGFMDFEPSLGGKWLQMLKEVDPRIRRIAILFNPETAPNRSLPFVREFEAAAASLRIEPIVAFAQDGLGIEPVVKTLASEPGGGLLVLPDEFTQAHRRTIIDLVERYRVPAIYGNRYAAATGGLIAYGPTADGLYRGLASYIDRILRGAHPGDLPIQAPTIYSLVVNLRTARMLGLSLPPTILTSANDVIE